MAGKRSNSSVTAKMSGMGNQGKKGKVIPVLNN
jgi:hypothetical protein